MKKIIVEEKVSVNRNSAPNIPSELFRHKKQVNLINRIYMDQEEEIEYKRIMIRELERKLVSYKNQDIIKNKYLNNNIGIDSTVEKLVSSKLRCYYCRCKVKILYDIVKDPFQWTLDRIDNDLPHEDKNVIISCLKCNLQRRKLDKDKFLFTKQLKIVKEAE